jgi:hypothetical protein
MKTPKKNLNFFSLSLLLVLSHALTGTVQGKPSPPSPCGNLTALRPLRTSQNYGIFGNDEFDTIVCGHLVTRTEKIWDTSVNVAYFRISQFAQPGFQQAIAQGIAAGNRVNAFRDGQYEFNLGCFAPNRITGQQYDPQTPYLNPATQTQLLNSTPQKPIAIVLTFGKHAGSDCTCCNLAHSIRSRQP